MLIAVGPSPSQDASLQRSTPDGSSGPLWVGWGHIGPHRPTSGSNCHTGPQRLWEEFSLIVRLPLGDVYSIKQNPLQSECSQLGCFDRVMGLGSWETVAKRDGSFLISASCATVPLIALESDVVCLAGKTRMVVGSDLSKGPALSAAMRRTT